METKKRQYNKKAVNQYDLECNFIRRWDSITEAAEALGIRSSGITLCCQRKYQTSGKFVWRYAKPLENKSCEKTESE